MPQRFPLTWQVGFTDTRDSAPAVWVPAEAPGAVQLDWARAHGWGPVDYGENWQQYLWMEDVFWTYTAPLTPPPLAPGERLFFVSRGIDYRFQITVNGSVVHDQEGMFTPVEVELRDVQAGDTLAVHIWPAPKSRPAPADRVQANQSCKPAVSYGWDFHPRLIPLGIWDDTYLEVRPACHLRDTELHYTLTDDYTRADIRVTFELSTPGAGMIHWELCDPAGAVACCADGPAVSGALCASLDHPELWWPNGQGTPTLYTSRVTLRDADGDTVQTAEARVGFRRVRLVMHPTQWKEPVNFPKTRSTPPITLEINGRAIFAKGANWVSPEIFPGAITAETYRPLLDMAAAAHMNLLRLWGGAIVGKEAFYEQCDERGLLLWQEFPLACNRYEGTPAYLDVLDQESRAIIRRLRRHPSVALWCGGNELFNVWSGMTEQDLPLRLLNRNCYDLDPTRPFMYTSPLMGMGHGHYVFRSKDGAEVYQSFVNAGCTAYTEFGCGGPTSAELLRRIIPPDELFPPRPGTAWESHHAVLAWEPNSHLLLDVIEDYCGPSASLEALVAGGQWLQAEGLKCLFEEARRQKPRAAMALNWCFNEPWLTAANMSIVSWPAEPKPAYYAVAGALRPVLASARISKFRWQAGELFTPELWLLNDQPAPVPAGRMEAYLCLDAEPLFLLGWDYPAVAPNTNLPGPVVRIALPPSDATRLSLVLRVVDHPEMDSAYTLVYLPGAASSDAAATRRLNA